MGGHDGSRAVEEGCMVSLQLSLIIRMSGKLTPRRTDAKTVSIVALATFHPNTKVQSAAIHFFLGSEHDGEDEDSDEEDGIRVARKDVRSMEHRMGVGKTGRKQEKQLRSAKKDVKKVGWLHRFCEQS